MPDRYIEQVLNGDKDAYRFIIRACKDDAYNLAISILKEEYAAKEAVQRAFLKAWEGLGAFRREAGFRTWFYRIVVNESFQLARTQNPNHRVSLDEAELTVPAGNAIYQKMDDEHKKHYIREVLSRMKPGESLALNLFYLHDYSIREVCDVTGWSASNTKVTLHRARNSMRVLLEKSFNLKPEDLLAL